MAGSLAETPRGPVLQFELAEISLIGAREENQDRMASLIDGSTAMIAVFDGMGGHSDGARAAELARQTVLGRLLNFGDVTVVGVVASLEPLHGIKNPLELRRKIGAALHRRG